MSSNTLYGLFRQQIHTKKLIIVFKWFIWIIWMFSSVMRTLTLTHCSIVLVIYLHRIVKGVKKTKHDLQGNIWQAKGLILFNFLLTNSTSANSMVSEQPLNIFCSHTNLHLFHLRMTVRDKANAEYLCMYLLHQFHLLLCFSQ